MFNIIFEFILAILLIAAYVYNDKTGKVTEFEQGLWQSFCDVVNYYIRKYERRKKNARSI